MTPEDLLRAGLDPKAYYPNWDAASQARAGNIPAETLGATGATTIKPGTTGVNPQGLEALRQRGAGLLQQGGQMFEGARNSLSAPGGLLTTAAGADRVQRGMGGKSGAALGGIGTLLSGDPLGALVSTPVGIGAGAIANRAITAATQPLMGMGPWGKAAGTLARVAIPGLVGGGAQQAVAGMVGGVKAKAGESAASPGGADVSVGGIPLTEAARSRMQQERDIEMERKRMQTLGGAQLGLDREVLAMNTQDYIAREKAILPLQEQINRSNLVNAQAKLASEGSMYQALGRQAGMFKLAQGAQAEAGATLRTAISQNPYMGATLSAPSISFG
jgi:hypothetical protein